MCGDWVRARLGDRTVLAGVALGGGCLGLAVLSPVAWLAVLGFALTGLALCNAAPILFNVAGRIGADAGSAGSTRAVGGVVTLAYAGVMAAPPLLGLVAQQSSLAVALGLVAGLAVLLGASAFTLPARVAAGS